MDLDTGVEIRGQTQLKEQVVEKLKNILTFVYNDEESIKLIEKLSNSDLLALAFKEINGPRFATPSFDPAKEEEIDRIFKWLKLPEGGKVDVYDGRTGQKFEEKVTVG
ncbi:MAG: hypothetical protein N2654_02980, partial [Deltaproteobacteria bacterium]|nr:hypothetical protein [Deltaproteobacteria bacterium]